MPPKLSLLSNPSLLGLHILNVKVNLVKIPWAAINRLVACSFLTENKNFVISICF